MAQRSSAAIAEQVPARRGQPISLTQGNQDVEIAVVDSRRMRDAFIRVPWTVFKNDPNWVPPLVMNERKRIGPVDRQGAGRKDCCLWIARIDGKAVGRISAQLGEEGAAETSLSVGQFGWIDAIDSTAVFDALFAAAEGWLFERGVRCIFGPFSSSINEETGVLIDGFDSPPMILMPHSQPHYAAHLERLGYAKEIDLYAYKLDVRRPLPRNVEVLRNRALKDPDVKLRQLNLGRFEDEIVSVLDLFNDAWSGNWGFVPFTKAQMTDMAQSLKLTLPKEALSVAEYKGRPVAFALGLPNINEVIRDLDGRLFPFGWAKLLYRLKLGHYGSGRLPLMGVRKEFQNMPIGAALAIAVIEQLRASCREYKVYDAELSWVLETNKPVRNLIEAFGGKPYKTYRIYSKEL